MILGMSERFLVHLRLRKLTTTTPSMLGELSRS